MSDQHSSLILNMPYIQPSQAQKHVTHNDALHVLDQIVQLVVLARNLTTPPVDLAAGDRYIVASGGLADWDGRDGEIAVFDGNEWAFVSPSEGWHAQDLGTGARIVFSGGSWQAADLGAVDTLGVNASADAVNRLAVSSEAVLFNHEGSGHRLVINKAASNDTASLIFQTGFSGRAEFGTAGNDNFSIKVTADGANWQDALIIDAATGVVDTPIAGWRKVKTGPTSYFVDPALGNDNNDGLSAGAGAFATLSHAVDVAQKIDAGGNGVTIHLADGNYASSAAVAFDHALPGASFLLIEGNLTNPEQVNLTAPEEVFDISSGSVILRGLSLGNSSGANPALRVSEQANLSIENIDFASAGAHIRIENAQVHAVGDYSISGGASAHIHLSDGGRFISDGVNINVTGAPEFTSSFLRSETCSSARFSATGFSGAATGVRYAVNSNGVIDTGGAGANFLPGDANGTTQSGGRYI
ncbi:MAG: DUF2793 domain-containing protein [Pseudomonadota bacterium]